MRKILKQVAVGVTFEISGIVLDHGHGKLWWFAAFLAVYFVGAVLLSFWFEET